jgi:hypothetical protein
MDETTLAIIGNAEALIKEQRRFLKSLQHSQSTNRITAADLLRRLRETTRAWVSLQLCAEHTSDIAVGQLAKRMYPIVEEIEQSILGLVEH